MELITGWPKTRGDLIGEIRALSDFKEVGKKTIMACLERYISPTCLGSEYTNKHIYVLLFS